MKVFNLEIKRFKIRKLRLIDVNFNYLNWFNEKSIKRFIGQVKYKSVSALKLYVTIENKKKNTFFLGIFAKNTNQHIGNIKFYNISNNDRSCELGIIVGDKKWRNKNVAYEVLSACLKKLKKDFSIKVIYLGVELINFSAIKLYKKLGFKVFNRRIKGNKTILDMKKII